MIRLAILLGGGLGALARYEISGWMPHARGGFPWSTFLINVIGSFLLALIYRTVDGLAAAPELRALLGIGFCAAFTTFSTFSLEAVELARDGHMGRAALYVAGTVAFCLAGTSLGLLSTAAMK